MLRVNEKQFLGWLESHNITWCMIADICHVSDNIALSWISPRSPETIPDMAVVILWNHFELDNKLELPQFE